MKNLKFLILVFASICIFSSCLPEDDVVVDNGKAPDLPPPASFIMPFDGFEDADTTGIGDLGNDRTVTFNNWFHSATNVVVWNVILTANLIVPVASFAEAFNHQAEFEGNGVWVWSYSFNDNAGGTYNAKLYGEVLAIGDAKWDMYISKVGGFSDVHWYTGTTLGSGSSATWTLNHQPNNPESFITINYLANNTDGLEEIRYTNAIPNNAGNGGYIEFRKGGPATADFNRFYDVFNIENDNLLEINWNETDKNGRVKDAMKFGDDEWHCWDENLQDTEC